ncbi:MAG: Protein OS-9 [Geoglossum umbratile]|nr:MAG: Protein OS-9 [Geoglossum umbratile]
MKPILAFLVAVPAALGSQRAFSVYDDLLAVPQYEIIFSDSFILEADATSRLSLAASDTAKATSSVSQQPIELLATGTESLNKDDNFAEPSNTYESMLLDGKRYLCAIPIVETPQKNTTSAETSQAEAENELSRATTRGWELLKEMEGNCLYFVQGWWSYSFCYNSEIKQFHQLPAYQGAPVFPPAEDPTTPSYVLGKVKPAHRQRGKGNANSRAQPGPGEPGTTELQVKGEMRYLVQKLRGGTICDLTGRERKIEIQYHCHPQSADRIGRVKEITTCSYLMVIYTPRLCSDVTFLPPRENIAHSIPCREVIKPQDIEDWKIRKTAENERKFLAGSQGPQVVGGIAVGATLNVGKEGRRIDSGNRGSVDVVASGTGRAKGGKVEMLTNEELRKLELDPKTIDTLREKLQKMAGDKGWKLEVFDVEGGGREIRGVLDSDPSDEDADEESEETDENTEQDGGLQADL